MRPLFEELGVSTVLVVGGSGDFFTVADAVIMMDERLGSGFFQGGTRWKIMEKHVKPIDQICYKKKRHGTAYKYFRSGQTQP